MFIHAATLMPRMFGITAISVRAMMNQFSPAVALNSAWRPNAPAEVSPGLTRTNIPTNVRPRKTPRREPVVPRNTSRPYS